MLSGIFDVLESAANYHHFCFLTEIYRQWNRNQRIEIMTTPFTIVNLAHRLADFVPKEFAQQNLLPDHPFCGAYISSEHWLDEPGHIGTTRYIVRCGYIALAQARFPDSAPTFPTQSDLLTRITLAANYLLRVQRPSGLIDLRNTNYESGPDTAFALQLICAFIEVARGEPAFVDFVNKLEIFARKAAEGVMNSGFHTPNHRWVIVGALAQAQFLFPEIKADTIIESYLAEGIDIDSEGAYLEHSIGVYDAVTNRSLLLWATHTPPLERIAGILDAVVRNLEFNLYLIHADGTAETGLSLRQDYGQRVVPASLIGAYLHAGLVLDKPEFIRAATFLWEKLPNNFADLEWQSYILYKHGSPATETASIPSSYVRSFSHNQLWRFRDGDLSASVFGGRSRILHLVYRSAELLSLKIAQAYFSVGLFIADEMEMDEDGVLLTSFGKQKPNLPAYHLPLGYPVAPEAFEESKAIRGQKWIPPATSNLKMTPVMGGFDFHYRTLDGLDDVIAQIALDFPAGGLWETSDTVIQCQPGNVLFLKQGMGRMRFGTDVIEIGPGACAHLAQAMRHSEPTANNQVRVLITFRTPVDHQFGIRLYTLLDNRR